MPYHVRYDARLRSLLAGWELSDAILVDVYLALADDRLGTLPQGSVVRMTQPFEGMVYSFTLLDPEHQARKHTFLFHVLFDSDESTLWVIDGCYIRTDNL